MRITILLGHLLVLAACGGADPTPAPDDAANAAAINASVDEAVEDQEAAEELVEDRQAAEERSKKEAEEILDRGDAANRDAAASNEAVLPIQD
jgi:predicted small lipoprotein YifL